MSPEPIITLDKGHTATLTLRPGQYSFQGLGEIRLDSGSAISWRYLSREEATQLRDALSSLLASELEKAAA